MAISTTLFVAGAKGAGFLALFLDRLDSATDRIAVDACVSYASSGLQYDTYGEIKRLCSERSVRLHHRDDIESADYAKSDVVLVVGWQYLMSKFDGRCVVLHDSLLPKLRGFNPTVTSLIIGETQLGATAFRPAGDMDTGPVLAQRSYDITYPVTVREVYARLATVYADLACTICADPSILQSSGQCQIDEEASYSIWRDDDDYRIDWSMSAAEIRRFVDAVGWPYLGAKTSCGGDEIRIHKAVEQPDLPFAIRQPGKLLAVGEAGHQADVVCGSGILRIQQLRSAVGAPFVFKKLRLRLV